MSLHILDHPLASHFVTHLRDETTKPSLFRLLCKRVTTLLAIEASRGLPTEGKDIMTPLEPLTGQVIRNPLVAVPILRAGLGMLDPIVEIFPDVTVGYIGMERNELTAVASSYYAKLPPNSDNYTTFVLDPMLATGGSATQSISLIRQTSAGPIKMLCIVAAPDGVAALMAAHPDIEIHTAALDRALNGQKYILPGLGDFGDRLYGT